MAHVVTERKKSTNRIAGLVFGYCRNVEALSSKDQNVPSAIIDMIIVFYSVPLPKVTKKSIEEGLYNLDIYGSAVNFKQWVNGLQKMNIVLTDETSSIEIIARKAFDYMDKDNSGYIYRNDFVSFCGSNEIEELREFQVAILRTRAIQSWDLLSKAYDDMDVENNGDIEFEEFEEGMHRLKVSLSDAEIQQIFKLMDSDASNYVGRNEFTMFLTQRFRSTELTRFQDAILKKV